MSRALKISIALNVALATTCTFLLVWNLQLTTFRTPDTTASPGFDWRQLDAVDFPTFVHNLRSAGCPEATIRDIITGEVTELYREKERDLLSSSSPKAAEAMAAARGSSSSLAQLHAERDRTIAKLLSPVANTPTPADQTATAGDIPATASVGAASAESLASQPESLSTAPAANAAAISSLSRPVYPAIYAHNASVAAIDAGLARPSARSAVAQATTPTERAVADAITQKFVEAVGPTPQDPNDPDYRQRWDAAVQMSDRMYADHFGARALQKRQIDAAVQLAQQQAGMAK